MAIETERKFLVKKEDWSKVKTEGVIYKQGYMLRDENKNIRVRLIEGNGGYITIKGKTARYSRPEYEYPLPAQEAEEMLLRFCDMPVIKKRYKIMEGGKCWEVDEFLEDNEGLIIAELELEHEDEFFDLPGWIDYEVTDDHRYYNSELSVRPFKSWT